MADDQNEKVSGAAAMERLYTKLKEYSASDFYPFHMPGHKSNPQITVADLQYGIDITEIYGFDDLHHASSILPGYIMPARHTILLTEVLQAF